MDGGGEARHTVEFMIPAALPPPPLEQLLDATARPRQALVAQCGGDARKWAEAEAAALSALGARRALWDGVLEG